MEEPRDLLGRHVRAGGADDLELLNQTRVFYLLRAWANDPHESRPHQCAPRILKPKIASRQVLATSQPAISKLDASIV